MSSDRAIEGGRPRRARLRSLAQNVALGVAVAGAVFGVAEATLRLTGLAPAQALRSADLETLEAIPGLYQPGQHFVNRVRRDLPSRIRINNLGFRGDAMAEEKPQGVVRLMALGDSYTFGDHVDTDEAYPARLEKLLGGSGRVQVINAGVNGFGILDETELWRKAGARLDPDIVLLTFSPNDISDGTRETPVILQMRRHAELKGMPVIGSALRLLQRTAIFNGMQILAARARVLVGGHDAIPAVEPARAGPDKTPEAWEAYRSALVALGARLASGGHKALLIHYPSHGIVSGAEEAHAARLLPLWANDAGMAYLDLLPVFREHFRQGESLYLVPRDSHPSPRGQALAASTIAAELDRLGWLGVPGS